MGRRAFLASLGIGLGVALVGCTGDPGGGGTGTRTTPLPGPGSAEQVMDQAKLAPAPDGAPMEMIDREAPAGYQWAREVTFEVPAADVDPWAVESFGSATALARAYAVSPQVAKAFEVDAVPDTWRMRTGSVEGTYLEVYVLVDDADPAKVRIHVRRRDD